LLWLKKANLTQTHAQSSQAQPSRSFSRQADSAAISPS
jgi:hypothetical protein